VTSMGLEDGKNSAQQDHAHMLDDLRKTGWEGCVAPGTDTGSGNWD
jgi:hypothetical protein